MLDLCNRCHNFYTNVTHRVRVISISVNNHYAIELAATPVSREDKEYKIASTTSIWRMNDTFLCVLLYPSPRTTAWSHFWIKSFCVGNRDILCCFMYSNNSDSSIYYTIEPIANLQILCISLFFESCPSAGLAQTPVIHHYQPQPMQSHLSPTLLYRLSAN